MKSAEGSVWRSVTGCMVAWWQLKIPRCVRSSGIRWPVETPRSAGKRSDSGFIIHAGSQENQAQTRSSSQNIRTVLKTRNVYVNEVWAPEFKRTQSEPKAETIFGILLPEIAGNPRNSAARLRPGYFAIVNESEAEYLRIICIRRPGCPPVVYIKDLD